MVFRYRFMLIAMSLILMLDRATKHLVSTRIPFGGSVKVWGEYFQISHIKNTGIAFGLFRTDLSNIIFSVLTAAAIVYIFYYYRMSGCYGLYKLPFGLLLGGASGNLYDRLFHGGVIDFLDFGLGAHRFPSFNVADSSIFTGLAILSFIIIKYGD